jgi:DNA-directed RNA polymerase specialized sigma24 family protein
MTRAEVLAILAAATKRLAEAQEAHDQALLAAADDNATLTEMGAAIGTKRQTVRGRVRSARKRQEAKTETEGNQP